MDNARSIRDLDVTIMTDDDYPPTPREAVMFSIGDSESYYLSADAAERVGRALVGAADDWRKHAGVTARDLSVLASNLAVAGALCEAHQAGWTDHTERYWTGRIHWEPGCGRQWVAP